MSNRAKQAVGWRSPAYRTIMLVLGWTLAIGALGSTVAGLVTGMPLLSLAGAGAGFLAWAMSRMVPDPLPAMRKAERRRANVVRQYTSHRLPG